MRVRKVVHRQKVKVISPEREDRKVKTRNESKKTNFMTVPLIMYLDGFVLLNQEPISNLESQFPPYPPTSHILPITSHLPSSLFNYPH